MPRNITTRDIFMKLNVLYFSQLFFMVCFGVVALYRSGQAGLDEHSTTVYKYILLVFVPVGWATGYFVFKNLRSSVKALGLKDKLGKYQAAMLIRAACLEVPGLFGGVITFITGDRSMLLFMAIEVVMFVILRPTPQSLVDDLSLESNEKSSIEDPETVLYQGDL